MSTIVKVEQLEIATAKAGVASNRAAKNELRTQNMSPPRFYLQNIPPHGSVCLSNEDAKHASSVLRLKVGESVQLFDGQDNLAEGVISRSCKSAVEVEVRSLARCSRELCGKLELCVALPKGDRQRVLIDLLVQFGAFQMIPLVTSRGVAQPTDNAIERLEKYVIESSKQCCRNWLMRIAQPISIDQLCLEADQKQVGSSLRLIAHPYGESQPLLTVLKQASHGSGQSLRVAIGPEGGFTDDECEQLIRAGWSAVGLGSRILRVEAAAAAIAATWAAVWESR